MIDAGSNKWIENIDTSNNAHSVAANSHNNHIYVSQRSGAATCGTLSGCVSVYVVQNQEEDCVIEAANHGTLRGIIIRRRSLKAATNRLLLVF